MIEIHKKNFYIGKKSFFLYAGEIHYFRIPPRLWKKHLERAKEAGLNTISSYIPWCWHESSEGEYDFEGKSHPQKNLIQFLDLVKKSGLYFSARVGPVSNAELSGEGLPAWLLKKHPEIFIQKGHLGSLPHSMLLSYLHPVFQELVGRWYDHLLPIVADRQVTCGGNIVMVQLCNEIGMIHWLHKAGDPAENVTRMYRDFLKEKYGTIAALNEAYGSKFTDFEMMEQPDENVTGENLAIFFDWALFYRKYYSLYFDALARMAKKQGIDVPLSANIPQFYDYDVRGRGVYSPMTCSLFRDFAARQPGTVFGGAYQMRRLDFENFHDIAITSEMTRMLEPNAPAICAELQTGIMRDRPRLYPADVDLNVKTSAAHGLNGINCYMFSSGENGEGVGAFGTWHDWQAPVSLDGETKEHFAPLKEWGSFVRRRGSELAATAKVTDTTVGFYLPYYATEYFWGPWVEKMESIRTRYFFDGMARLLQLAGYHFSVCDLMKEPLRVSKAPSVCLFAWDFMDEKTQKNLAEYVRNGGKLLIGPKIPTKNLLGKPCTILADSLGLTCREESGKIILWHGKECYAEGPFQIFDGKDASPLIHAREGGVCAAQGKLGKGKWLAYGFGLAHLFDHEVEMIREWMILLDLKPQIESDPWDVHAVLRKNEAVGFLFLFNYHDVPKQGKVTLRLKDQPGKAIMRKFKLERRSGCVIPLKFSSASKREKIFGNLTVNGRTLKSSDDEKNLSVNLIPLRGQALQRLPKMDSADVNLWSFRIGGTLTCATRLFSE